MCCVGGGAGGNRTDDSQHGARGPTGGAPYHVAGELGRDKLGQPQLGAQRVVVVVVVVLLLDVAIQVDAFERKS